MLVAVHPWDVDGAARADMSTACINRTGPRYPDGSTAPGAHRDRPPRSRRAVGMARPAPHCLLGHRFQITRAGTPT